MNQTTRRSTAFRSLVPTILVKLLAVCWIVVAVGCLSEVLEHAVMGKLNEAVREALIYCPLAAVPAAAGVGLWRQRRWGRRAALAIGSLAVLIVAIAVAFCCIVALVDAGGQWAEYSFGLTLLLVFAGPPTVVVAAVQGFLLTRPAVRALFELPAPAGSPLSALAGSLAPNAEDGRSQVKIMSRKPLRNWIVVALGTVLVAGMAIMLARWLGPWERHNIRYQADGTWAMPQIPNPAGGNMPDYGVGVSRQGQLFRVIGHDLHVRSAPNDLHEIVVRLPDELLIPPPGTIQTLQASADGEKLIYVNDLGIAVWRTGTPYKLLHHWAAKDEPAAGPKVSEQAFGGSRRYDIHKLTIGYAVSPDGRLVCVHAVLLNRWDDDDSNHGVVGIRNLETGEDVARLVHENLGPVIDRVAWSGDSQRLATANSPANSRGPTFRVTVWDVAAQVPLSAWPAVVSSSGAGRATSQDAGDLALSSDGAEAYVLGWSAGVDGKGKPQGGLSLHRTADGSLLKSCTWPTGSQMVLSPVDKYVALVSYRSISLVDSATFDKVRTWYYPAGSQNVVFSRDGGEVALTWFMPNEIFGSASGVKAWDTATGEVVLAAEGVGYPATLGFTRGGSIVAGRKIFVPIVKPNPEPRR